MKGLNDNGSGFAENRPLDEFAYQHDILHFDTGTNGAFSSLLSTNPAVAASDYTLAGHFANYVFSNPSTLFSSWDPWVALGGSIGFSGLATIHTAAQYSYLLSIYH